MPALSTTCLDDETLAALHEGRLTDAATACVDDHLDSCAACRELVTNLARVIEPAADAEADNADRVSIGRYVVLDLVGAGSMGVVHAAYDPDLDRKIALKLLHSRLATEVGGHIRGRMLREARAMARLSHENVVRVHDVGVVGEQLFIAAELIDGVTLREWLAVPRTWREILDAFLAAGRGLASAHDAGIVHRDFKPSNVLVGRDGRVAVGDFGLARVGAADRGEPDLAPRAAADGARETAAGALIGTPAYMAPEQRRGEPATARSDQFSFCVALHEALHGVHPFATPAGEIDVDAALAGRILQRAGDRQLPAWLDRAIERGLRPDPASRHPTMLSLLRDIERHLHRRRRRKWYIAAASAVAVTAAAGYVLGVSDPAPAAARCDDVGQRLVGVWDARTRDAAERAFAATRLAYAGDSWTRVAATLDRFAERWITTSRGQCEELAREGPSTDAYARGLCLERQRVQLAALSRVFAEADATVVEGAVRAAAALPGQNDCVDPPRSAAPPPASPADRQRLDELRTRLAHAQALSDAGAYARSDHELMDLMPAIRALDHPPLTSDALRLHSELDRQLGRLDRAVSVLLEAVETAELVADDRARADALTRLALVLGVHQEQRDEGQRFARLALAAVQRLAPEDLIRANALHAQAMLDASAGKLEDALALARRATELWEKLDHPLVAAGYQLIGSILRRLERYGEAKEFLERALTHSKRVYGPDHPHTAAMIQVLGNFYGSQGKAAEAAPHLERALAMIRVHRGPVHLDVAGTELSLGHVRHQQGQLRQALSHYERCASVMSELGQREHSVALTCELGAGQTAVQRGDAARGVELIERVEAVTARAEPASSPWLAQVRFELAKALWAQARDRRRARRVAEQARDGFERAGATAERAAVASWLAEHRAK